MHQYLGVDMPTKAKVKTAIAAKRAREADGRGSLGDAAAEPVVKAVRKPCTCACCGRSAVSSYSIASSGDSVSLGRECCGDIYAEYMSHKDARETCEDFKSDGGHTREQFKQAAAFSEGKRRSFLPQTVGMAITFTTTVQRRMHVMNGAEFRREIGCSPTKRATKRLPTMLVPKESGDGMEQVWVFRYQPAEYPYLREVCVGSAHSSTLGKPLMTTDKHGYEDQGGEIFSWSTGQCKKEWDMPSSEGCVVSVADFRSRTLKEKGEGMPLVAGTVRYGDGQGCDVLSDDGGTDAEDCDRQDGEDLPAPYLFAHHQSLSSGIVRGASRRASTPTKVVAVGQRTISSPMLAMPKHQDGDAAESETGSCTSMMKPSQGGCPLAYWTAQLSLPKTLAKGKNGVARHHAEKCAVALSKEMPPKTVLAKQLRQVIELNLRAELLYHEHVKHAEPHRLAEAIRAVSAVEPLPLATQRALVIRKVAEVVPMNQHGKPIVWGVALDCCMPWSLPKCRGDEVGFDNVYPKLSLLPCEPLERLAIFRQHVLRPCLDSVTKLHEDQYAMSLFGEILSYVEEVMASTHYVATTAESDELVEIAVCCRALRSLARPSSITMQDLPCVSSDVLAFARSHQPGDSLRCLFSALVADDKEAQATIADVANATKAYEDMGGCLEGHAATLASVEAGRLSRGDLLGKLPKLLEDTVRVRHSFPPAFANDFVQRATAAAEKAFAGILSDAPSADVLDAVSKLAATSAIQFPFHARFAELQQEIGLALQKVNITGRTNAFADALKAFTDAGAVTEESATTMSKLARALSGIPIPSDMEVAASNVIELVLSTMVTVPAGAATLARIKLATTADLHACITREDVPTFRSTIDALSRRLDVYERYDQLKSATYADGKLRGALVGGDIVDVVALLQRAVAELQSCPHIATDQPWSANLAEGLRTDASTAQALVKEVGEAVADQHYNRCKDLEAALQSCSGGLKEGAEWTAAMTDEDTRSFKSFVAYGRKTILKDGCAAKMKKDLQQFDQELDVLLACLCRYELNQDRLGPLQDLSMKCWVTHVSGLLMHSFATQHNKADLRNAVARCMEVLAKHRIDRGNLHPTMRQFGEAALVCKLMPLLDSGAPDAEG